MKRFFSILLVLTCLSPMVALADTITIDGVEMDIEPSWLTEEYEKKDQQLLFVAYPNPDENAAFHSRFSIKWYKDYLDLSSYDSQVLGQYAVEQAISTYQERGITASNPQVSWVETSEIMGLPVAAVLFSLDMDFSGLGIEQKMTVYMAQTVVSSNEIGTYLAEVFADSEDTVMLCINVLNTARIPQ